LDFEAYEKMVLKFDPKGGSFINNCPLTENILPFGKFVVARLYLEAQEEIRKRTEREAALREVVEKEATQDGCLRISSSWDTDDDLDLFVQLPEGFGKIAFREQCVDDVDMTADVEAEPGMAISTQIVENLSWPDFDSQATGSEALLCPPIGEYRVWLQMSSRRAKTPCHWACQVVVAGHAQMFGGTWHDGDSECIELTTAMFSNPSSV
jgi:hypothetical protein